MLAGFGKGVASAFSSATSAAKHAAESVAAAAAGSQIAQSHAIGELTASAGPGGAWKVHRATLKRPQGAGTAGGAARGRGEHAAPRLLAPQLLHR